MAPTAKIEPVIKKAKLANTLKFQRKNVIKLSTTKLLNLKPAIKTNNNHIPNQNFEPLFNTTEHPSLYLPKTLPNESTEPITNRFQQSQYYNEIVDTNRKCLAVLDDNSVRKIVIVPKGSLTNKIAVLQKQSEKTEIQPRDTTFDGFLESLPKKSLENDEEHGVPIAKKFLPFLRKGWTATFTSVTQVLTEIDKSVKAEKKDDNSDDLMIRRFETLLALFNRIELELQNHAQYIQNAQIMQSFMKCSYSDDTAVDMLQNPNLTAASNKTDKISVQAEAIANSTKRLRQTINEAAKFEKAQSGSDPGQWPTTGDLSSYIISNHDKY